MQIHCMTLFGNRFLPCRKTSNFFQLMTIKVIFIPILLRHDLVNTINTIYASENIGNWEEKINRSLHSKSVCKVARM